MICNTIPSKNTHTGIFPQIKATGITLDDANGMIDTMVSAVSFPMPGIIAPSIYEIMLIMVTVPIAEAESSSLVHALPNSPANTEYIK